MKRKWKRLIFLSIFMSVLTFAAWQVTYTRIFVFEHWYDLTRSNPEVWTKAQIDTVLDRFETVSVPQLDPEYDAYSLSDQSPYHEMLKGKTYFVIRGNDIFQRIAGPFRIRHFLCRDTYFSKNLYAPFRNQSQYLLLDRNLVYKLLALMKALEADGHNPTGFAIRSAFRHPLKNKQVGGASKSRHIKGEAIDLSIRDINQDGKRTQADKQIVLDLLDKKIIQSFGGIGRYPGSFSVHFDVRGYRARWDSY